MDMVHAMPFAIMIISCTSAEGISQCLLYLYLDVNNLLARKAQLVTLCSYFKSHFMHV